MKALVFAAGFGTRLMPYTAHTPKPLFTIGGRPVLDLIIERLIDSGCTAVVVNTHHLSGCIEKYLNARTYPIPVTTRFEPHILDTGGAIKNIGDFLDDEPFLAVNGDIVTDMDYAKVYEHHLRNHALATLVLHDCAPFNNISVDRAGSVTGLRVNQPEPLLAFTGVQVINPEITDHIPENTACSIIEIYQNLIAEGRTIQGYRAGRPYWVDMGTPENYIRAAMDRMVPEAFSQARPNETKEPVKIVRLKGDGSDRKWSRLLSGNRSLILGDHGIRESKGWCEADAFVSIATHLKGKELPVPEIYHHDTFSGLVFMEDLGDTSLEASAKKSGIRSAETLALYKKVAELLKELSTRGGENFDLSWTWQTKHYDRQLILEKECDYFLTAFLNDYLGMEIPQGYLDGEFSLIADGALTGAVTGFMHRDFQSRNIMVKDGSPHIIDFQGGRKGPVQYDLASLLIDPYVSLDAPLRQEVLNHFISLMPQMTESEKKGFLSCYHYCRITRNLQMLGAFAFLSQARGKHEFESHIPAAVASLEAHLVFPDAPPLPRLKKTVEKIRNMG